MDGTLQGGNRGEFNEGVMFEDVGVVKEKGMVRSLGLGSYYHP